MTVNIIYETHSTTIDNENGVATGWLPGQLSGVGRAQARELGERRGTGVDVVFSSDLARAVETAEIAFGRSDIPIHQDLRLRECNYGSMNGGRVRQLDSERIQHVDEPWPGGESYRDVVERTRSFLRDLATTWDGGMVVAIAHSANRWALDCLLREVPLESSVATPFDWQPGWHYSLPAEWTGE